MNLLRSFVDFEDPAFSRAAAFATAAAVMATVPLACIAYILHQATIAMPSGGTIVDVTAIVVAAIVVQIPLATAGARALRASLDRNAERLRIRTVEHLRKVPARTLASLEPGQVLSTMTNGLDDAIAIVAEGFTGIFGGLLKAAGAIAIVAVIDWRIAGFALVFFPLVAAYVRQSRIVSARATPRLVRAQAEGVARFYEYVESIALLRAFGCTAERLRRLGLAVSDSTSKPSRTRSRR